MPLPRNGHWASWVAVILGFSTLGIVAYTWYFGFATLAVLQARYTAHQAPILDKKPVAVGDLSQSRATGMELTFCGHKFEVPWTDLDESETKSSPNRAVLHFRSGLVLMLSR